MMPVHSWYDTSRFQLYIRAIGQRHFFIVENHNLGGKSDPRYDFYAPKELWGAYSNRTVRPSVRPASCPVHISYIL